MSQSIPKRHAHDLLELVADATTPFTTTSLTCYVNTHWGKNVRFHTCKLNDLSLEELLTFLISRKKVIVDNDDNLQTNRARMCNH